MDIYKGKSKCSCGRRANWRVVSGSYRHFACNLHKDKLSTLKQSEDSERITEADEQTWKQL